MVWPGPSSRASRIAPATLMPEEPPRHSPFVLDQIEHDGDRLLVGDLKGDVDGRAFEIPGDAALADPFGDRGPLRLEHAGGVIAIERRAFRIGKADLDHRIARLQREADARERAAGADRASEAVDPALGLLPDFRAGGRDVPVAIGDIVELVGPDGAVR